MRQALPLSVLPVFWDTARDVSKHSQLPSTSITGNNGFHSFYDHIKQQFKKYQCSPSPNLTVSSEQRIQVTEHTARGTRHSFALQVPERLNLHLKEAITKVGQRWLRTLPLEEMEEKEGCLVFFFLFWLFGKKKFCIFTTKHSTKLPPNFHDG